MRRELSANIIKQCPLIYRGVKYGPSRNLMCFGFDCDSGWYELIFNLSVEVEKITSQLRDEGVDIDHLPIAVQVKEKFGGLRIYVNPMTEKMSHLIAKAERESFNICETCGAKGQLLDVGGIYMTRCKEHQIKGIPSHEVTIE